MIVVRIVRLLRRWHYNSCRLPSSGRDRALLR